MNFMDLYEVCKPYVEYVEANMRSIQTLSDVEKADSFEDFLTLLGGAEVSLEKDLKVFDKAFKLQLAIESPIREEVATEIIRANERQKKSSEMTFADLLGDDIPKHEYSHYEPEYTLADDFEDKIKEIDTDEMSFDDIEQLLSNWLGR